MTSCDLIRDLNIYVLSSSHPLCPKSDQCGGSCHFHRKGLPHNLHRCRSHLHLLYKEFLVYNNRHLVPNRFSLWIEMDNVKHYARFIEFLNLVIFSCEQQLQIGSLTLYLPNCRQ